jgi:uncharacterized RmlC-like cupin family protein
VVTLPQGQRAKAYILAKHETVFCFLSGDEGELWTGDLLRHREKARPGNYLFIPAGVPHVAVNRGAAPAVLIGLGASRRLREA